MLVIRNHCLNNFFHHFLVYDLSNTLKIKFSGRETFIKSQLEGHSFIEEKVASLFYRNVKDDEI